MTQYQAHVRRLKDALAQPHEAAVAKDTSRADIADAADVVGRVQQELVGEAASHAQGSTSEVPVPHRPALQPAVPNSTRCMLEHSRPASVHLPVAHASKWHTSLQ